MKYVATPDYDLNELCINLSTIKSKFSDEPSAGRNSLKALFYLYLTHKIV